ncbi:MAG: peptidylprolyl isomerase [Bernardetiaceae bacterium]|jgi:cyclophilin family peptidyl-prolyl cis-trans isomerase/HEAT repeat protein|nr:peptidylprolyl isomerase [Bernardetiaceae bacterium]
MRKLITLAAGLALLAAACRPRPDAAQLERDFRRITDFQDQRRADSLRFFLTSPVAEHRRWAAGALASVQDTASVPALATALADPEPLVRRAAAYALGQTYAAAARPVLRQAYSQETDAEAAGFILEALGKCADSAAVAFLATLDLPQADQAPQRQGQMRGLYRAALQKKLGPAGVEKTLAYLNRSYPDSLRVLAAGCLARNPRKNYEAVGGPLLKLLLNDPHPHVRLGLAVAAGSLKTPEALGYLKSLALSDANYQVQVGALRGMANFEAPDFQADIAPLLRNANPHVALTAAELLHQKALPTDRALYLQWAQTCPHPRARAEVLAAAVRYQLANEATEQAERWYRQTASVYEKGWLLKALAEDPRNFALLDQRFEPQPAKLLNTFALEALTKVRQHPYFPGAGSPQLLRYGQRLQAALASGDAALVALAAGTLREDPEAPNFLQTWGGAGFLAQVKQKLQLPRDYETLIELEQTLALAAGQPPRPLAKPAYQHPINWALLDSLPPRPHALLETTRGTIELQLLPRQAPGSVANFVALARRGFFSAKALHRVVPNHVAQGGCPRGDGFGGPPHTIRSELGPLYYQAGSVGMASAGKDTEGSQWFISLIPTNHLDGQYTIFAQVVKGLEVAHQLQVGDEVRSVRIVGR